MGGFLWTWKLWLLCWVLVVINASSDENVVEYMSKHERESLKEEARAMFYHAYNAYMENAYPADELMPLSCKGRFRGSESNRGDMDYALGNFSLALVDTLDTLVVLGDFEEFENAVKLVIKDVTFDTDVIVSLFETNIRMLGGLLSSHILAEYLQQRADLMTWYRGELLNLAKDLGYRFLPAFNTTTGIPYGRVNLKHGMKGVPLELSRETCTACAGSMILEMAALSRLTGESVFEEKAHKAMDFLWKMRHRGTDLMGSVLNVHSGDWVRRDSGVGAGIDSYYEYCLKAYILLGDEKYLGRFNRHYQAVMKYVSQGPMLLDVHMNRPNTNTKNFMDALLAFWPGLQVLKGDIKPAVETHEMLYQVMQRHNFIPEAFTTDFQVHWGHHPLRPEFLESTYFLYRATGDHYYLNVGRKVLRSLQTYARVPCGYAAMSDVRTNKHDDTMDSFFLSETLKYLFLLFAEPTELALNLDEFIFTTEGHLLPLTLSSARTNISTGYEKDVIHVDEMDRTCPNSLRLFPASVRQPLRNMVEDVCPRRMVKQRLSASQFQPGNAQHVKILSEMGIIVLTLADGRIQLLHTFANAKNPVYGEEGVGFMQEMVQVSKVQAKQSQTIPQAVSFKNPTTQKERIFAAGPAHFGPILRGSKTVVGQIALAMPSDACTDLVNPHLLRGKIAVVDRGNCVFVQKARQIQRAGAIAGIVLDNVPGTSAATSPLFAMSGDEKDDGDVEIPLVFLFHVEAMEFLSGIRSSLLDQQEFLVTIGDLVPKDAIQLNAPTDVSMFERLKVSLKDFLKRQILPQHSPDNDQQREMMESDRKYHYGGLVASVVERPEGKVVLVATHQSLPDEKKPPRPTADDKDESSLDPEISAIWDLIKQSYVSEIDVHESLTIDVKDLQTLFAFASKGKKYKVSGVTNASLDDQIFWLLKEFAHTQPSRSLVELLESMPSRRLNFFREQTIAHLPKLPDKRAIEKVEKLALSQNVILDSSLYNHYHFLNTLVKRVDKSRIPPHLAEVLKFTVHVQGSANYYEEFIVEQVERAITGQGTNGSVAEVDESKEDDEEATKKSLQQPEEMVRKLLKTIQREIKKRVRVAMEGGKKQKLQEPVIINQDKEKRKSDEL